FMFAVSGNSGVDHWVVSIGDYLDINDGKIMRYPVELVRVRGILKLYENDGVRK
ncbi:unnamed protein product, partial [marine sediment metagenome]